MAISQSNNPQVRISEKRKQATPMMFPSDLESVVNNNIQLYIYRYARGNPLSPGTFRNNLEYTITLPLPNGLIVPTSLKYSEETLAAVGGTLGSIGSGTTPGNIFAALASESIYKSVTKFVTHIGKVAESSGAPSGTAGIFNQSATVLGQAANYASNPNLALSFEGVSLRSFDFSWTLIPKSEQESYMLDSIIGTLRRSVLPRKYAGANLGFAYPYVFDFKLQPDNLITVNKLGFFAERMNVNYEGDSGPSFYKKTGRPTAINLSLSLKERSILTAEDYGAESANIMEGLL